MKVFMVGGYSAGTKAELRRLRERERRHRHIMAKREPNSEVGLKASLELKVLSYANG